MIAVRDTAEGSDCLVVGRAFTTSGAFTASPGSHLSSDSHPSQDGHRTRLPSRALQFERLLSALLFLSLSTTRVTTGTFWRLSTHLPEDSSSSDVHSLRVSHSSPHDLLRQRRRVCPGACQGEQLPLHLCLSTRSKSFQLRQPHLPSGIRSAWTVSKPADRSFISTAEDTSSLSPLETHFTQRTRSSRQLVLRSIERIS